MDQFIYRTSRVVPKAGRAEALSVPGVKRGRDLICSIATLPLVMRDPDRRVIESELLRQIDPNVANVVTVAQTAEDLLFEGISWWRVLDRDPLGFPTKATHLDVGSVSVLPPAGRQPAPLPSDIDPRYGVVWVDGHPVASREVIRFDSPNPGLLKYGGRAILRSLALDETAKLYSDNPRPGDYFTPKEGVDPPPEKVQAALDTWAEARRLRTTAYIPAVVDYNTVDVAMPVQLQLVEQQKQAAVDVANALGLDAEDLNVSTTSRTYQNAVDRRQDRINDVFSPYMQTITQRLSMDDVTPFGYVIVFKLDDYLRANPTERWAVYKTAREIEAMSVDEIRAEENLPAGTRAEVR